MISQPPIQLITHSPVCKRSILLTIAYNSRTNEYPSPFPTLRILSPEKGAPRWNGTSKVERLVPVLAMVRLIGLISLIVEYVCVSSTGYCTRVAAVQKSNILNNTGKLKSDIYRRGEKWMDFPVENPRWILDTQCRSGYLDTGWYPALFGNRSDFQKEP